MTRSESDERCSLGEMVPTSQTSGERSASRLWSVSSSLGHPCSNGLRSPYGKFQRSDEQRLLDWYTVSAALSYLVTINGSQAQDSPTESGNKNLMGVVPPGGKHPKRTTTCRNL